MTGECKMMPVEDVVDMIQQLMDEYNHGQKD